VSVPPRTAVRAAHPDDVPALVRLVRDLAAYEREPDAVRLTEDVLAERLFGPEPAVFAHVAEADGRVVGMAVWFLTFSTWTGTHGIWLEDLFVEPEARGSGLGRRLLAALAAIAVERGYARLEWTGLDWNAPALGFYRALGAVGMEDWTTQRLQGSALAALAGPPAPTALDRPGPAAAPAATGQSG
jgi:GNAT superfamily N-acetyltransferase